VAITYIARTLSWLLLIACLLLCTSCGWQLQGRHAISEHLQPLYVEYADIHSPFSRSLQERLRLSGIPLVAVDSEAAATLHITRDETSHRVISVSKRNTPEEYEINYSIEFSIKSRNGEIFLQQPLSSLQTITYDESHALAKQREENMLIDSMAAELADQLLRQMRRL
jgi:LPS-assembly lipoprotein